MAKKVFELAKELELNSLELVETLKGMGFSVRNHMSSLTDEDLLKFNDLQKENKEKKATKKKVTKKKTAKKKTAKKTTKKAAASDKVTTVKKSAKTGEDVDEQPLKKKTTVRKKAVIRKKAKSTTVDAESNETLDTSNQLRMMPILLKVKFITS